MDTLSTFYASSIIHPRRQRGVGLLEVMIAVLVLGIGVLGVLGLQTVALKNSDSSALSSQATIQVYAMFDLLRAKNNKKEGGTGVPAAWTTGGAWKAGSKSGKRDTNNVGTIDDWLLSLKEILGPEAEGLVECSGGNYSVGAIENERCKVAVRWNDSRGTQVTDKANERMVELEILL